MCKIIIAENVKNGRVTEFPESFDRAQKRLAVDLQEIKAFPDFFSFTRQDDGNNDVWTVNKGDFTKIYIFEH